MLFKIFLFSVFFAPLLSFVVNACLGKIINRRYLMVFTIFILFFYVIGEFIIFYLSVVRKLPIHLVIIDWFSINNSVIYFSLLIDQLVASMLLVISLVSFVVHIYSFGYTSSDQSFNKFIALLSLFTFLMMLLICADNFLQLFLGWEGVGMCSYLLIGYYHNKASAASAAMKAFIVNRVSDFAFVIAIIIFYVIYESLNFNIIFGNIAALSEKKINLGESRISLLEITCFLLLLAAMGKSAQIGFHVWLPDAMEGPTPVSALIHSATMVTAGVFLLVKTSFLFEYTNYAIKAILLVGIITSMLGGIIAIAQSDIKKIIAYSTCSQLGYMFCACGLSGYNIAIFHLMTHGFFKSMLFLCAGNVIYATHQQNIFNLGGLRSVLNKTHSNFLFATLALSGIFPLSGFYSKDLILELAYSSTKEFSNLCFYLCLFSAFLTSIYSFKIISLVFYGQRKEKLHVKEPGSLMQIPLYLVLIGSLFSGSILFYILEIDNANLYFNQSIFTTIGNIHHDIPKYIKTAPMLVSLLGIITSLIIYLKHLHLIIANYFNKSFYIMKENFFFDKIYEKIFIRGVQKISFFLHQIDVHIIDKLGPKNFTSLTNVLSKNFTKIQTGYLTHYLMFIIISIIIISVLFVLRYKFLINS
ncbi:MAG: NADH-quinone oxidoreductase subunit L [Rickettsia sp.]|nr:NADH-quinone oxidoreductase subunit L [Rickettsia sp.]